jgi:hypothetical protein
MDLGRDRALSAYLSHPRRATRWRDAHRSESQTRGPLLACAAMFREAMSQSFVKNAGNVLNSLHESKALDPRACNAYQRCTETMCD